MSGSGPPDPHPVVTALTRQFSWLWRIPTWGIVALLVALLLLNRFATGTHDARLAQAIDDARVFLKGTKPFHGMIASYQQRESAALRGASQATAGMAHQLRVAQEVEQATDSAKRRALAAAKTAHDSVVALGDALVGKEDANAHLKFSVDSGLKAIDSLSSALRYADSAAAKAVRRADSAEVRIRALVKAQACTLLLVLPCIKNVHIGPSYTQGIYPSQQRSFGLSVVWSP